MTIDDALKRAYMCMYVYVGTIGRDMTVRWSLVVSRETDTALRQFLASQGGGRKGDCAVGAVHVRILSFFRSGECLGVAVSHAP